MWASEAARNEAIRKMLATTSGVAQLWSERGPTKTAVMLLEKGGGYLSGGERVLLRAAFDLWAGTGDCKVADLLSTLDGPRLRAVAEAILARDDRPVALLAER